MAKLQIMAFEIEGSLYGVDIKCVSGIFKASSCSITPLPNCSGAMKGITNIRGKVYPAIDLRKKFGYKDMPINSDTKFVVIRIENKDVGFIVDEVTDIIKPDEKEIIEASSLAIANCEYVSHIIETGENFVIVLKMEKSFINDDILKIDIGDRVSNCP